MRKITTSSRLFEKKHEGSFANFQSLGINSGNLLINQSSKKKQGLLNNTTLIFILAMVFQLFANGQLLAQTVSGKVINGNEIPLSGVSVVIKGQTKGTVTDTVGYFSISGLAKGAILVFSMQGHKPLDFKVSSFGKPITIRLQEDVTVLSDVIVTGFQNIDKKKFSGAVVKLKGDDVRQDGQIDISRMLEGKAAGVSVQNVSGTFGSAPKIRIRGATSITGENKPLWVIDGVALEDVINISNDQLSSGDPNTLLGSSVAGINANDIESIDILKDAAATAMYGARAMNGVIVVTTKKGRVGSGKPSIAYNGNFSTQFKPRYENFNILNSWEQMRVFSEMIARGQLNYGLVANRPDAGVYGKLTELIDKPVNGVYQVKNDPASIEAFLLRYGKENTDWFDILFKNQFIQEHSLSVSSGTEKTQSYFSASYFGDGGWTIADKVNRYTLNFRNDYKVNDKLSIGFLTQASYRNQRAPGAIARESNPVYGTFDRDFDINPFSYSLNTSRTLTAYDENGDLEFFKRNFAPFNIIHELDNNYLLFHVIDAKLQGNINYKLTKHVGYEFVGAIRYVKTGRESYVTEYSNQANAYRADQTSFVKDENRFLYQDPDFPANEPIVVLPYGGFYNREEVQLKNYDLRNSINYSNTFGIHSISGLLGQQVRSSDRQTSNNTGYGYLYDQGGIPNVDPKILKQAIEQNYQYYGMKNNYERFAAFYATVSYTYDRKYNFGINGRYDGSNRLGKSATARWLPTWSVNGSWNVDEENFLKSVKAVSSLKFRASYGLTASLGNATNSDIVVRSGITARPYTDEKETVLNLVDLENSELTWEKLYTLDIGLDGGLFQNRIKFTIDYYDRTSFDLINKVRTSAIGGEEFKDANFADMYSKGVEFQIIGTPVKSSDFSWESNFVFSYNKTKITKALNTPIIFDLVKGEGGYKEGYPARGLWSINFQGLGQNDGIPEFIKQDSTVSKDVYYQSDVVKYLKYEGPVDPTLTGGWTNTFKWKGLSLSVFLTYQGGNKIRVTPAFKARYSDLQALPNEFVDRYAEPGDARFTTIPVILDGLYDRKNNTVYPFNTYNYSSARVVDGDFVRLKSVSLNYLLPKSLISRLSMSSGSVTLAAYNLALLYSDKKLYGADPEFFNTGGVAQPIQKQMTLSLRLGF